MNGAKKEQTKFFSYYIPKEWDEDYLQNGMGWGMKCHQKKIKLKDRVEKIHLWGWGRVRTYLLKEFELEGFTKEVGDTYDGWTEVCFRLIEK